MRGRGGRRWDDPLEALEVCGGRGDGLRVVRQEAAQRLGQRRVLGSRGNRDVGGGDWLGRPLVVVALVMGVGGLEEGGGGRIGGAHLAALSALLSGLWDGSLF